MNSALFAKTNPVIQYIDATLDLSGSTGLLVVQGGNGFVVNTSATVPAAGIILDGAPPGIASSIMLFAANCAPVRVVAAGAITQYTRVSQDAGGGVKASPGSGNARCDCGIALEAASAAGAYIIIAPAYPAIGS
jgi:hypothetical protein